MHRELLGTYLLVFGGAFGGLLVGVLFVHTRPAPLGWLFGLGAGLMVGAFIAAIASNEPLVGGGHRREPLFTPPPPGDEDDEDDEADLDADEADDDGANEDERDALER